MTQNLYEYYALVLQETMDIQGMIVIQYDKDSQAV